MSNNSIALFCTLHPSSPEKQGTILSHLRASAREYYRDPKANCSAWSYLTPFPPPKPNTTNNKPPIIRGLEIYTTKQALQTQQNEPWFQSYHRQAKAEKWYAKPEELVAWYYVAGFVARPNAPMSGERCIVSVTRMMARNEKGKREVLEVVREFAKWVEREEEGVLTYAVFERRKVEGECVLFVRYRDRAALKGHTVAREHVVVVEKLKKLLANDMATATTLWEEVDDSFVTNGDDASRQGAKL